MKDILSNFGAFRLGILCIKFILLLRSTVSPDKLVEQRSDFHNQNRYHLRKITKIINKVPPYRIGESYVRPLVTILK